MNTPASKPPRGTVHGTLRWYVHRIHARPGYFGERDLGNLVWAVQPIVHGRGSKGLHMGAPTSFAKLSDALHFAHAQATRTYGPRETRP